MIKCRDFQFAKNMTFQYSMVKYHINKIKLITNQNTLLSCFKAKPIPLFYNEITQMVE